MLHNEIRKSKTVLILFCFLILIIIFISTLTVRNAIHLRTSTEALTFSYLDDVSYQVSEHIDHRISEIVLNLHSIADSLAHVDTQESRIDYLGRKAGYYGFDQVFTVAPDGTFLSSEGEYQDSEEIFSALAQMDGQPYIHQLDGQNLLYAVPLREGNRFSGIIGCIQGKKRMQDLIQSNSFGGSGVSCITDEYGKVVISPPDLKFFLALDDIFARNADHAVSTQIEQMKQDMLERRDGNIYFTTISGEHVLMAYNALQIQNWVSLTLIPADVIAKDVFQYIAWNVSITAAIILLFAIFIATLLFIYHRNQRLLEKIAFVDPVTQGFSINRFNLEALEQIHKSPPGSFLMASLNVRDFKLINEKFGSKEGDDTLRYIYHVLSETLKPGELAARGAADNFYLLMGKAEPESVSARFKQIEQRINAFNEGLREPYFLSISCGVYQIDEPELEIRAMQGRANTARQSTSGDTCGFYTAETQAQLRNSKELRDQLEHSLENQEFMVYFQPKVRLSDCSVGGAEALVRWQHPTKGFLSPADFIPVFEQDGSICKVDLFVFEEVCRFLKKRQDSGKPLFPISVNLSRRFFQNPDFIKPFYEIRQQYEIPEGLIELEITESVMFERNEIPRIKAALQGIHEAGFLCSLDDFGFGYSSISLLKELDVDTLKLDRSFFLERNLDQRAQYVISAILELTDNLGIHTVAEGIEYPEQLKFLQRAGCGLVQGYIFSKPLSIPDFEAWVEQPIQVSV